MDLEEDLLRDQVQPFVRMVASMAVVVVWLSMSSTQIHFDLLTRLLAMVRLVPSIMMTFLLHMEVALDNNKHASHLRCEDLTIPQTT